MKIIVRGRAHGTILKSDKPINFLGTVNKKTGLIQDEAHPLYQKSLTDSILTFPHGIGSSVGAYTIYSLKSYNTAPAAMICKKADLTVATGCALANIPLILVDDTKFEQMYDGRIVTVDAESGQIIPTF